MQVIAAFQKKNISIIHLFGLVTNYSASPQQRGESDGCQIPLREDMHLITKGRGGGGTRTCRCNRIKNSYKRCSPEAKIKHIQLSTSPHDYFNPVELGRCSSQRSHA